MIKEKCIIIGSGPAGYTAAIYAARANMNPVIITGLESGGQLMTTTAVENFPSYSSGIMGPELMESMKQHAINMGTRIIYNTVTSVDFNNSNNLNITLDDNSTMFSDTIIIATGATAKKLGIPNENLPNISACAVCDGFFYKNKSVAIVGGGDTACEEASYLSNICEHVTMLVRGNSMVASKAMQSRVQGKENITILYNTQVEEIVEQNGKMACLNLNNSELIVDALFVAIGHTPNSTLFHNFLDTDKGYITTYNYSTQTNISGVFACGDVQDNIYRQAITAAGSGCMAALDAERYLSNKNN